MKVVRTCLVTLLCFLCGTAGAQDKQDLEFIRTLLENFGKEYFEEAFDGKRIIENTLTIKSVEVKSFEEVVLVKGMVSYEGKYIPILKRMDHNDVEYKAELSHAQEGVQIRFWLWHISTVTDWDNYWLGPFTKVVHP